MNLPFPPHLGRILPAGALLAASFGAPTQDLGFSTPIRVSTNELPDLEDFTVADLTGDGIQDVLYVGATSESGRRLYIAPGLGSRDFAPLELLAGTGTVGTLPMLGDIDGDGDTDLGALDGVGGFVAYENDGSGGFTTTVAPPFAYTSSVALADADADGDLDAFVQRPNDDVVVGIFDASTWTFDFSLAGVTLELETAVDLNGDGRADLVGRENGISVLPATGAGYGAQIVVDTSPIGSFNRINILVEDLDLDGNLDLLPVGAGPVGVAAFLGDGAFGFTPTSLLPLGLPDPPTGQERYIHADADGILDLIYMANVMGDPFFSATFTSLGTGALPFAEGTPAPITSPFDSDVANAALIEQERFQDVDDDGATDLVTLGEVRFGPFAGTPIGFEDAVSIVDTGSISGPSADPRPFDVDGDGQLDLVTLDTVQAQLLWSRNEGGFVFGELQPFSPPALDVLSFDVAEALPGQEPVLAELHATAAGNELRIWQDAGGGAAPVATLGVNGVAILGIADLDADGIGDVVTDEGFHALDASGAPAALFPIDGLAVPSVSEDFVFEDLDEDGDVDIVRLANSGSPAGLNFIRNVGGGTSFAPEVNLFFVLGEAALGDVDGDGRLDLIAATDIGTSVPGLEVTYLRGQGALSFGAPVTIAAGLPEQDAFGPLQIDAVDLDGDGDLDVSISNYRESLLISTAVLINNLGTTAPTELVTVIADETAAGRGGYADLDGDGDLDAFDVTDGGALITAENVLVPRSGAVFCEQPNANSSGATGRLDAYGVPAAGGAPLRLVASGLPMNSFGFFVGSPNASAPAPLTNSNGFLCLGAGLGRYSRLAEIGATGAAGSFELAVAPDDLRTGATTVTATAGLTWSFQAWHRDVGGSPALSNLTSGVTVTYE
ncbi:MAG: VCBS repeat-containing protein [Planctomycetota bacterium]